MVFVSNDQSSELLKPGKQALNLPSASITSQLSAVLSTDLSASSTMRRNYFNTALLKESIVEFVAVICFVADQLIRSIFSKAAVYSGFNKLYFMGRSAFNMSGDRKTRSVCDCHDLGALAALCLANSKTPFFAGAKLPSMNASRMSIFPRSCRSATSSSAIFRKTPNSTHRWNQRWHVWCGGYLCGRSFQGAPVRRIHSMPSSSWRGSVGFRPLGSFCGIIDLMMGAILFHCSFVSSILIVLHI